MSNHGNGEQGGYPVFSDCYDSDLFDFGDVEVDDAQHDSQKLLGAFVLERDDEFLAIRNKLAGEQIEIEQTYDIQTHPVETEAHLTNREIAERLEIDHAVKQAPRWKDQLSDTSRGAFIVHVGNSKHSLGTITSNEPFRDDRVGHTEHRAILKTDEFLRGLIDMADKVDADNIFYQATSMQENMTFIGEKEYEEAVSGIAAYWKYLLDRNPHQQIVALASEITKQYNDQPDDLVRAKAKSDQYMLERILEHFTDEELDAYKGRLVADISEISTNNPHDLRVVLLDDWTISGSQLSEVASNLMDEYPELSSSIEIQLIASNEKRITRGLQFTGYGNSTVKWAVPIRSYYKAHHSDQAKNSSAHITGYHSSVDFDFEEDLARARDVLERKARRLSIPLSPELASLPPLTNIVRPYRMQDFRLTQTERLERINSEFSYA